MGGAGIASPPGLRPEQLGGRRPWGARSGESLVRGGGRCRAGVCARRAAHGGAPALSADTGLSGFSCLNLPTDTRERRRLAELSVIVDMGQSLCHPAWEPRPHAAVGHLERGQCGQELKSEVYLVLSVNVISRRWAGVHSTGQHSLNGRRDVPADRPMKRGGRGHGRLAPGQRARPALPMAMLEVAFDRVRRWRHHCLLIEF